jgi:hypothetical protein
MNDLWTLLWSPTLAAAIVAAAVSYLVARRSIYINSVTVERSKWIGELRTNIARLSGQILTINQKQIFNRKFGVSDPEYHQYTEEIHRLTSLIKLQLNPFNEIDKNILLILDELENSLNEPHSHMWFLADRLLIQHAQWLLKAEWEKVKFEAASNFCKPFLWCKSRRRIRQYRLFSEDDGRVNQLQLPTSSHKTPVIEEL